MQKVKKRTTYLAVKLKTLVSKISWMSRILFHKIMFICNMFIQYVISICTEFVTEQTTNLT